MDETDPWKKEVPGANVIKLFTMVIYRHSMVILSFCVKKTLELQ
jgi:hypothetical protein